MLRSMTAFGRAVLAKPHGRFIAEIQTVNRRHLEIQVAAPQELARFDSMVKKIISSHVLRGQVIVKLSVVFTEEFPCRVRPNIGLAKELKAAWDAIALHLDLKGDSSFGLKELTATPGVLVYEENSFQDEKLKEGLSEVIAQAVQELVAMKRQEGESLCKDIEARSAILRENIEEIARISPKAPQKFREKLQKTLEELLQAPLGNDERLLKEVCLYAEKVDTTEEIIRFRSHLEQLQILIEKNTEAVGKTLEFVIQELNREINTIASKSSDLDVTRCVITIKSELEKIREQIQNVE